MVNRRKKKTTYGFCPKTHPPKKPVRGEGANKVFVDNDPNMPVPDDYWGMWRSPDEQYPDVDDISF